MKSINLLLSKWKSQTNYGFGSSSLDQRERWPCMVHFDQLTLKTAPHFITLITTPPLLTPDPLSLLISLSPPLLLFLPFLIGTHTSTILDQGNRKCQTNQWSRHVSRAQLCVCVCALIEQRAQWRRRWIFHVATGNVLMSLVVSVRLIQAQDLAGSEPCSESTVKPHGWFDCSHPHFSLQT